MDKLNRCKRQTELNDLDARSALAGQTRQNLQNQQTQLTAEPQVVPRSMIMEPDILDYAAAMNCPELHMTVDNETGLRAIIAIHSTVLGPALGGCRFLEYPSTHAAVIDAIRLAQGMTYKAAISNLPLGGGKMVILKPKEISDKVAFFKAVGRAVDLLRGRYITAEDSGTSVDDMDVVSLTTKHVVGTSKGRFTFADPSVLTAHGVEKGIRAAVHFQMGKDNLNGVHIAIQGVGHVGYKLAKELHNAGAKLTVFDIKPEAVQRCVSEFNAKVAPDFESIVSVPADVFAPCALGAVLNDQTIPLIQAPIVAGCANNQLQEPRHGEALKARGILYAPDYVINAGGLIYVAAEFAHLNEDSAYQSIENIYNSLMDIFTRSEQENRSTNDIADIIAQERVNQKLLSQQRDGGNEL